MMIGASTWPLIVQRLVMYLFFTGVTAAGTEIALTRAIRALTLVEPGDTAG